MKRLLSFAEIGLIALIALAPVFASFPYRINIFLSWEGAYRMAEGQVPFRDFGMPVGYMYWVIPAIFFKLLGAQLITLVKAQAFINILAGLAFRSIFKSLNLDPAIRFLSVLVFCLSYTFFNYWPWYNHTVIVYELIALAFLFKYLTAARITARSYGWVALSGAFVFFAFFTKQDGGGLALMLCLALLAYHAWLTRKWLSLPLFLGATLLTGLALILPIGGSGFAYWFNHGQAPHSSRISITEILREFFTESTWIKFYLFLIVLLVMNYFRQWKETLRNKEFMLFLLLTLGILAEASIFQVTSYVPVDNNIFFHSFAFAFILSLLADRLPLRFTNWKPLLLVTAAVFIWWSPVYWKYVERFVIRPGAEEYTYTTHGGYRYANVVNKNTFMVDLDTTAVPLSQWRVPQLRSFHKILLPGPTVDGIERLLSTALVKSGRAKKVLNMTELTPLAAELPFSLETGPDYPLWFHKGVGMFEKETRMFTNRIAENYYDLVLYEYIPYLNNFNAFAVREALQKDYQLQDRFPAPRNPSAQSWIEVYVRKPVIQQNY